MNRYTHIFVWQLWIYIYIHIYIYTRISWVEKCVPAMSPSISLFIPSSIYIPLSIFIPDVDACLSVRVFLCLSGFVFFAFVFACCMWFLMCFVLCVSVWSNSCHGLFSPHIAYHIQAQTPMALQGHPSSQSNSHGFRQTYLLRAPSPNSQASSAASAERIEKAGGPQAWGASHRVDKKSHHCFAWDGVS